MTMPKYPSWNLRAETVILDRLPIHVDAAVSDAVLRDLATIHRDMPLRMSTVYSKIDPVSGHLLLGMRAWLLKGMHVEMATVSVSVPATWWDHLKDDFLKSGVRWKVWLAGRFAPPQYVTKSEEYAAETRVCPHNDTYFSESKQHIEYLLWGDND